MAAMKTNEIRKLSAKELQAKLQKLQAQLAEMHVNKRTREFKPIHRFAQTRADIARVRTLLREAALKEEIK